MKQDREFIRRKREAKKRFFEIVDKLRAATINEKPEKMEKIIREAIKATRIKRRRFIGIKRIQKNTY